MKNSYSPVKEFIKKFTKQTMAMASLVVIVAIVLIAVLSPYFVPYDPIIPVTNQYQQKGLDIEHLTTTNISYKVMLSDGSIEYLLGDIPTVDSVNRRVAAARAIRNNVITTAVTMGETYVKVSQNNVTSLIGVTVTKGVLDGHIITSLITNQPQNYLYLNEKFSINITALLSDESLLTQLPEIQELAFAMEQLKGTQNTNGGWGSTEQGTLDLTFTSLNPQIATVNQQGIVTAIQQGVALIQVSLGDLQTIVQIPVETTDYQPVPVAFIFNKSEVELIDIYKHQPPSSLHWFGTDHQNRDIFSRIMVGTRQTLIIGFLSVAIGTIIGTALGLIAGYYGGIIDSLLTRFCDVLLAFPGILLAIAVIAILGPGIYNIIFAVSVFTVPIFIRIVRASTLSLKNMTYVEAAKSMGVKDYVIIFRHIFPGTLSVVIVYFSMRIGTAILIGASLSYLGLGGDITAPEWGAMLNAAKNSSRNVFHPTLFPGLAIVLTVLAFNLLGDGLRDALDPKIKD